MKKACVAVLSVEEFAFMGKASRLTADFQDQVFPVYVAAEIPEGSDSEVTVDMPSINSYIAAQAMRLKKCVAFWFTSDNVKGYGDLTYVTEIQYFDFRVIEFASVYRCKDKVVVVISNFKGSDERWICLGDSDATDIEMELAFRNHDSVSDYIRRYRYFYDEDAHILSEEFFDDSIEVDNQRYKPLGNYNKVIDSDDPADLDDWDYLEGLKTTVFN